MAINNKRKKKIKVKMNVVVTMVSIGYILFKLVRIRLGQLISC
jgi:hypothetical protein